MIRWCDDISIFLHREPVDFRKSINGLCVIVQENMSHSLQSRSVFVFCNKPRDKIKVLYWDRTGFALWYKRLEQDKFKWPSQSREPTLSISSEQWDWLLRGLDFTKIKPHKPLFFRDIA